MWFLQLFANCNFVHPDSLSSFRFRAFNQLFFYMVNYTRVFQIGSNFKGRWLSKMQNDNPLLRIAVKLLIFMNRNKIKI